MSKHRLINCEFINSSSFKVNLSNKAKLLYFFMFVSADDKGFVDSTDDLIKALDNNDEIFTKTQNLSLLGNDYTTALVDIINKGLIYEFRDNHGNTIHLIRHWWYHNQLKKGLWTNYFNFLEQVEIKNNEYVKKPLKENKINQNNVNQNKESITDDEWDKAFGEKSNDNEEEDSGEEKLPFEY